MIGRESADEIEAAAVRWVWRLDRDGHSPGLDAELDDWLAGDTRRRGALLHAEATWAALDRAGQLPVTPSWAADLQRRSGLPRRALLTGGAAIAASIAGLGLFGLQPERYGTELGEIRRVPLKDGSTAAINTQSAVDVALSPSRRVVKLRHGEAWFQVAKNPHRPFIVEAGRVRVRAVGTAFSVRRRDNGADVLVTEGVVEAWADGAEGARIRISAGAKAFVADDAAVSQQLAGPSELDRELAWRGGKIDLAGETLAQAVGEFNRYNSRKLVIADGGIANERLFGIFRTDDPEGFANSVHASLGVGVSLAGADEIRLSARATKTSAT